MRALHLLGLPAARRTKLRYTPPTDEPLILPSWLPPADREILLSFYQQILGDAPLSRIEVDWDYSLLASDARFLRHVRLHHGAERDLLVVRVRRAGVDLHDVALPPEIAAFQFVAIACDHPALNETVGRLRELTELVSATAQDLYEELTEELALRADGVALIEPLVRTLLSPIPVLEAYNALIRLHGEPLSPDAHRDAIFRSVLGRLLDDLPAEELAGLAALALRGSKGFAEALGEQGNNVDALLRARMVLLDGRLSGWARFLEEPSMREVVENRVRRLVAAPPPVESLATVHGWLAERRTGSTDDSSVDLSIVHAWGWITEGKLSRAAEMLTSLERRLDEPQVSDQNRGDFWNAVGLLRESERQWEEAELAYRRSLTFYERDGHSPSSGRCRAFASWCRWAEAEPLFREALRLVEEGSDPFAFRPTVLRSYAHGLRSNGRIEEAQVREDEAARLAAEASRAAAAKR